MSLQMRRMVEALIAVFVGAGVGHLAGVGAHVTAKFVVF